MMHCKIVNYTGEKHCEERIKPLSSSNQSVETLIILNITVPVPVNRLQDLHTKHSIGKSFTYRRVNCCSHTLN